MSRAQISRVWRGALDGASTILTPFFLATAAMRTIFSPRITAKATASKVGAADGRACDRLARIFAACNRGLPLYRDRTTGVKQEPIYCVSSDTGCNNPNYMCTAMGTVQQCCPTSCKKRRPKTSLGYVARALFSAHLLSQRRHTDGGLQHGRRPAVRILRRWNSRRQRKHVSALLLRLARGSLHPVFSGWRLRVAFEARCRQFSVSRSRRQFQQLSGSCASAILSNSN